MNLRTPLNIELLVPIEAIWSQNTQIRKQQIILALIQKNTKDF